MTRHLVWDWNGTLFNDFDLTITATNAALAAAGGGPVTGDEHRGSFRRPIAEYYGEVLGRPVSDEEFITLDGVFHARYHQGLTECGLTAGAADALRAWHRGAPAHSQSLLSMWYHDKLVPLVDQFGLSTLFTRVDGLPSPENSGVGSKTRYLERHLAALGRPAADCVMIGDTLDDALAAESVGARCVLITGGFTDAPRLAATGHPVATTPAEAIALAAG